MSRIEKTSSPWTNRVLAQRNLGAPAKPSVLRAQEPDLPQLAPSSIVSQHQVLRDLVGRVAPARRKKVESGLQRYANAVGSLIDRAGGVDKQKIADGAAATVSALIAELGQTEQFLPSFYAMIGLVEGTVTLASMGRLQLDAAAIETLTADAASAVRELSTQFAGRSGLPSALNAYAGFVSQLEAKVESLDLTTHQKIWAETAKYFSEGSPARGLDQTSVARLSEHLQTAIAAAPASPFAALSAAQTSSRALRASELQPAISILTQPSPVPELSAALHRALSADPEAQSTLGKTALLLQSTAEQLLGERETISWDGLIRLIDWAGQAPFAEDLHRFAAENLALALAQPNLVTELAVRFEAELPKTTAAQLAIALAPHTADAALIAALEPWLLQTAKLLHSADPGDQLRALAARFAKAWTAIEAYPELHDERAELAAALAPISHRKGKVPPHIEATVLPLLRELRQVLSAVHTHTLLADDASGRPGILRAMDPELKAIHSPAAIMPALFQSAAQANDLEMQKELARRAIEISISTGRIAGDNQRYRERIAYDWNQSVAHPDRLQTAVRAQSALQVRADESAPSVPRFLDRHPELWCETALTAGWYLNPRALGWTCDLITKMRDARFARSMRDFLFATVYQGRTDLQDELMASPAPKKAIVSVITALGKAFQANTDAQFPYDAVIQHLRAGRDPMAELERAKNVELLPGLDLAALAGSKLDPAGVANIEKCHVTLRDLLTRLHADTIGVSPYDTPFIDMTRVRDGAIEAIKAEAGGSFRALKYDSAIGQKQLAGLDPLKRELWKMSDVTNAAHAPPADSKELLAAMGSMKQLLGLLEGIKLPKNSPATLEAATAKRDELWTKLHELRKKDEGHAAISKEFGAVENALALFELRATLGKIFTPGATLSPIEVMLTVRPLLERAKKLFADSPAIEELTVSIERAGREIKASPREGHYAVDEDTFEAFFNTVTQGCMSPHEVGRQWGLVDTALNAHSKMVRVFKDGEQRFRGTIRVLDAAFDGYSGKVLWVEPPKNDGGRPGAPANTGDDEDWALFYQHVLRKGQSLGIPVVVGCTEDLRHHLVPSNPFNDANRRESYPCASTANSMGLSPRADIPITFTLDDGWTGAMQSDPLFYDVPGGHNAGSGCIEWFRKNEWTSNAGKTHAAIEDATYNPTITANVIVMPAPATAATSTVAAPVAVDELTAPVARPKKVRFAPSPSGDIHVGNATIAVANFLFAKKLGAELVLRLEDTDPTKSKPEHVATLMEDLKWLGIKYDGEPAVQSKRGPIYRAAVDKLLASGHAYKAGDGAIYFRMPRDPVQYVDDRLRGRVPCTYLDAETGDTSPKDFVLIGSDGLPKFILANTVDDIEQGVTHVIRGEDHLHNGVAAKQICLYRALGEEVPEFYHLGIILGDDGRKLSKRKGKTAENLPTTVRELRQRGVDPLVLTNHIARVAGMRDDSLDVRPLDRLIDGFNPSRMKKSGASIGYDMLDKMIAIDSKKKMARMEPDALAKVLAETSPAFSRLLGREGMIALADLSRKRAGNYQEAIRIGELILSPPNWTDKDRLQYYAEDRALKLRAELSAVAGEHWTLDHLAKTVVPNLVKDRAHADTLRWLLLGVADGPPLANILTILGRDQVLRRIDAVSGI